MILDQLNRSILTELKKNSRSSNAEIGRKIGLSAPAVAERINKMVEEEVISLFTVDLNYSRIGYMLQVLISIKLHPGKLRAFRHHITGVDQVIEANCVTGNDCMILKVIVKSTDDLEAILADFGEYGDTTTSVILSSPLKNKSLVL